MGVLRLFGPAPRGVNLGPRLCRLGCLLEANSSSLHWALRLFGVAILSLIACGWSRPIICTSWGGGSLEIVAREVGLKKGSCTCFFLSQSTSLLCYVKSGLEVCSFGLAWGSNLVLISDSHQVVYFSIPFVTRSLLVTVTFLTVQPPYLPFHHLGGKLLELRA